MTLVSLDIETACGVGCEGRCEHALDEHRNRVTVVGCVTDGGARRTFRELDDLRAWLAELGDYRLVGHNFKFDLKTLAAKGLDLAERWEDDTLLMAAVLTEKVSDEWLAWYAQQRARLNEDIAQQYKKQGKKDPPKHREGSAHSLKCLAPFFVGVAPFWEDPTNHDNDDYVLTDVEHTLRLYHVLKEKLRAEDSYEFYKNRLLPWTRMLLAAERTGISLDFDALSRHEEQARETSVQARAQLDTLWAEAYAKWEAAQRQTLFRDYQDKSDQAVLRLKDKTKEPNTRARYLSLYAKAAEKLPRFNLDSPKQLTWLMRDHLGLDITDFDGEETTGKAVLQKLAAEGRDDIREFLRYRKATKLSQAFFPSWREMAWRGALHTTFNPTGTRTGRLSSSGPNLQQVPRDCKKLFCARPGHKLIFKDANAIEPRLILYYTHDVNLWDIIVKNRDFHNFNTAVFFDLDHEGILAGTADKARFKKEYETEREVGKEVGLSILYGAGYKRLQESAMKRGYTWSDKECRRKVERFKEFYEGVYRFRDEVIGPVLRGGETILNLLGRPLRIEDPDDVHLRGLNRLIQGGASDLVLNSAHRAQRAFEENQLPARVILLEHDMCMVEAREECAEQAEQILEHCMTDYKLETPLGNVPLAVEGKVATHWEK